LLRLGENFRSNNYHAETKLKRFCWYAIAASVNRALIAGPLVFIRLASKTIVKRAVVFYLKMSEIEKYPSKRRAYENLETNTITNAKEPHTKFMLKIK